MSLLTIALVEDDPSTRNAFASYTDMTEDVMLVSVDAGAKEAIQSICNDLPDAVILDLELQNGNGTGMDVLKFIKTADLPKRPFILVVSDYVSGPLRYRVQALGADFIFSKKQDGFSERYVVDFLRDLSNSIHQAGLNGTASTIESPRQRENRTMALIKDELLAVGITPRMKGFRYLSEGIAITMNAPQQNLADAIAQSNQATRTAVTRAMEYAIDSAWKKTDIDILTERFKARVRSDTGVPTVLEFVYYYADQIKRRL